MCDANAALGDVVGLSASEHDYPGGMRFGGSLHRSQVAGARSRYCEIGFAFIVAQTFPLRLESVVSTTDAQAPLSSRAVWGYPESRLRYEHGERTIGPNRKFKSSLSAHAIRALEVARGQVIGGLAGKGHRHGDSLETTGVFVSWVSGHGRSRGLAEALGLVEINIWLPGAGGLLGRYWRSWGETLRRLRAYDPGLVVVMQPPFPSFLAVVWFASRKHIPVGVDLHTGSFDNPKWRWALPWILRIMRPRDVAIVTNHELAKRVRKHGRRAVVCHDVIDPLWVDDESKFDSESLGQVSNEDFVLVPFAWDFDEPIAATLDAAAQLADVTWVITGRVPPEYADRIPANVVAPGFVSADDYRRLVARASVLCALTTSDFTMQQVGYEATSQGKALVTSDFGVLRDYHGSSAVYTRPDGTQLVNSVRTALDERKKLESAAIRRRSDHLGADSTAIGALQEALRGR